ncbi:MAG: ABC transporter permease [Gemmatimonadaceae bacterium]|nr:ABC transporter permease [Gemmatimonadaceae bacterium]
MHRVIGRRLLQAVPLLLLLSAVLFGVLQLAPGGPLATYLENPNVRPEDIARLERALGLDRPAPEQYVRWLAAFVRGDWGYSYADGRPVLARILERVPATAELVSAAVVLALLAAVPAGVYGAVRRGVDRATTLLAVAGISLPVFWAGLVLQLVFAVWLGWLPSGGRVAVSGGGLADRLAHLILPATVLAVALGAAWSRYLRRSVREAMAMPFTTVARARGVSASRVVWRHAVPVALPPFVTVVLVDVSLLVSGAVVTEGVFAWPGLGQLFIESLAKRDYAVLMAVMMMGSVSVVLFNLIADLIVLRLDPRTRHAGDGA